MSRSETISPAPLIARGVARMLADHGFAALGEFSIGAGWRMDLCALGRSGEIWCVEIKSSRADFTADSKWPCYLEWCDRFFFAVAEDFPDEILPADEGLIRADAWGAEILRYGPERRLAPARRKSLTLAFARTAATRLRGLIDPPPGGSGRAPGHPHAMPRT